MSSSLSGLKAFVRAVLAGQPWRRDPRVVRKRWSAEEYALVDHGGGGRGACLCFAVMWDDGVVVPHPPVRRALEMVKRALLGAGHVGKRMVEAGLCGQRADCGCV